jgi:hypothetical protein
MSFNIWERYSLGSIALGSQDSLGPIFISGLGQINLSGVSVLHAGVDTVRQLYSGILKPDVLQQIESTYDLGPSNRLIDVLGRQWLIGSGGKSGYRYRLQDNDLGVILLIGSRYIDTVFSGSHLKIELSPHFIDSRSTKHIQGYLDTLAARLLHDPRSSGCQTHLCVDIQGWEPPKDFVDLLVTRSRRCVNHTGIDSAEFSLSEIATIYGNSQSFLFGSPSGLQFSMYRKDLQVNAVDKAHFWSSVWGRRTDENFKPLYDSFKPVWRLEFRFHHSVINQFSEFLGEPLSSFVDLVPHFTGLFRYALGNFRLNAVSSSASRSSSYRGVYIDPLWQLLLEDVHILAPDRGLFYKRVRKQPGQGGIKNVLLAVGNLLSVYARNGLDPCMAFNYLKQSGVFTDYFEYIRSRFRLSNIHQVEAKIFEKITEGLAIRRLLGAFA